MSPGIWLFSISITYEVKSLCAPERPLCAVWLWGCISSKASKSILITNPVGTVDSAPHQSQVPKWTRHTWGGTCFSSELITYITNQGKFQLLTSPVFSSALKTPRLLWKAWILEKLISEAVARAGCLSGSVSKTEARHNPSKETHATHSATDKDLLAVTTDLTHLFYIVPDYLSLNLGRSCLYSARSHSPGVWHSFVKTVSHYSHYYSNESTL